MEARPASIANVPAPEAEAAEPAATAAAHDEVLVLDFGGQYSQLIARRVRFAGNTHSFEQCDGDEAASNGEVAYMAIPKRRSSR